MKYTSLLYGLVLTLTVTPCSLPVLAQANEFQTSEASTYKQSLTVKPANFSNINLGQNDGFGGYHAGLEYERLLPGQSHWAIVLPLTYARYHTVHTADFDKKGYELYITPGVKYYFRDYKQISGYSLSANLLAGMRQYDYSGELAYGNMKGYFTGLLINNHYALKVWKSLALHFELGAGIRYQQEDKTYFIANGIVAGKEEKVSNAGWSGIMNASVGLNFRF